MLLPSNENSRREKISKIQAYVKIYINNVYLAKTKPKLLSWPEFSFDLDNLFNLTVNTRPTRIHLKLFIKAGWTFKNVCEIEINPPGIYMNTVTSSSVLQEELIFDNSKNLNLDTIISNNSGTRNNTKKNNNNNVIKSDKLEQENYIRINNNNNFNNDLNSPGIFILF